MNNPYKIKMYRFPSLLTGVFGYFIAAGQTYFTVEDLWKNNKVGVSCIPSGKRAIELCKSGTNKSAGLDIAYNIPVDGRTVIRFAHVATTPKNVRGCIGVGFGIDTINECVTHSRKAVKQFYKDMDRIHGLNPIELEIVQL